MAESILPFPRSPRANSRLRGPAAGVRVRRAGPCHNPGLHLVQALHSSARSYAHTGNPLDVATQLCAVVSQWDWEMTQHVFREWLNRLLEPMRRKQRVQVTVLEPGYRACWRVASVRGPRASKTAS